MTNTLKSSNISIKAQKNHHHKLILAVGHTLDDVFRPAYFIHTASRLHVGDTIELISHDYAIYAELLVITAKKESVAVRMINFVDLVTHPFKGENDTYSMKHEAGSGWVIRRVVDKSIVEQKLNAPEAHEQMNRLCGVVIKETETIIKEVVAGVESVEPDKKGLLMAEAKSLGLKPNHLTGVKKLETLIADKKAETK